MLRGPEMMDEDTLGVLLRRYLDEQLDGEVELAWQGGEPMMRGIDLFAKAFSLAERLARPGQRVRHVLQTNGTLIDETWASLLADHQVLVGISMDGPAVYHDRYRRNKAGRGSHDQVLRGWRLLEEYGVQRNVLCTVHAANQHHPLEVYRYFRDELGATHMQFIPIVERVRSRDLSVAEHVWRRTGDGRLFYEQAGHSVTSRSVEPSAWGDFLSRVWDGWFEHDIGSVFVQAFDVMLGNYLGIYSLCAHAPECGNALVVAHNGDVYSCDHWVEEQHRLGNVRDERFEDMVISRRHHDFNLMKPHLPSDCLFVLSDGLVRVDVPKTGSDLTGMVACGSIICARGIVHSSAMPAMESLAWRTCCNEGCRRRWCRE